MDQRLDQHSDALEMLFKMIDEAHTQLRACKRADELLHRRIMVLEASDAQTDEPVK